MRKKPFAPSHTVAFQGTTVSNLQIQPSGPFSRSENLTSHQNCSSEGSFPNSHRSTRKATNLHPRGDVMSEMVEKFRAFLEQEEKDAPTSTSRDAQTAFWSEMRGVQSINSDSVGLGILDEVAQALIESRGDGGEALDGPVMILPTRSHQEVSSGPPPHPLFDEELEFRKRSAVRASPKGRKSKKSKAKSAPNSSPDDILRPTLGFELAPDTPKKVRRDIEAIYRHTLAVQMESYERAYPWEYRHLWYNPEKYPDMYVAHWRFWNASRPVFFEWTLHASLTTDSAQNQRRKRKMLAIRDRLSFLSMCIETRGYYKFLRRLEAEGNGNFMWWGGQAGRTTKEAKTYTCSAARDLVDLYHNDNDV
ncbi:unnamed protein product [Phytophthora fragariaefolia]|uniref:Unnamed protein product n=1 Tax=Phytophthora fragariaefolia TaxID=1490495 RepID=A0A9W6TI47_9STRA|nr:unnamed protein product [Phytophthora fragariaefolia]